MLLLTASFSTKTLSTYSCQTQTAPHTVNLHFLQQPCRLSQPSEYFFKLFYLMLYDFHDCSQVCLMQYFKAVQICLSENSCFLTFYSRLSLFSVFFLLFFYPKPFSKKKTVSSIFQRHFEVKCVLAKYTGFRLNLTAESFRLGVLYNETNTVRETKNEIEIGSQFTLMKDVCKITGIM